MSYNDDYYNEDYENEPVSRKGKKKGLSSNAKWGIALIIELISSAHMFSLQQT